MGSSCSNVHSCKLTSGIDEALVMAGCSAKGVMQRLHVVSFEHRFEGASSNSIMMNESIANTISDWALELRNNDQMVTVEGAQAGYFSICVKLDPGDWKCGITTEDKEGLGDNIADPLGLVSMAHHFRTKTISPGLM